MEPWYKVATPRKEVREGRSFKILEDLGLGGKIRIEELT